MNVQPFSLILSRLTPLFLAVGLSPLARLPGMVRLVLLIILALSVTSIVVSDWIPVSKALWVKLMVVEFCLGALLLLGFQLAYAAILMIGRVLDMQIGFAAAGVIDPQTQNNDPLLGAILVLFFTLLIFLTNTHLATLDILIELFRVIPPGGWDAAFSLADIMAYFATQLMVALLLFGPVMMGLWLLDLFNGFMAKTMPQMNVYFVMLPLKIAVGILLLSLAMGQVKSHLAKMLNQILVFFNLGWAH